MDLLTPRRLPRLMRRAGLDPVGAEVEEHERSGRNRMFLVRDLEAGQWLAKQALTFPGGEAWFYSAVAAQLPYVPRCREACIESSVVLIEYLPDARPWTVLVRDQRMLPDLLGPLAKALASLHDIGREFPDVPKAKTPFVGLDPVPAFVWINATPAARALIRAVQALPSLSTALRDAIEGTGTPGLIHGDLKLDNILENAGSLALVDWECAGIGAVEWDLAAVSGSLILDWVDRWTVQSVLTDMMPLDELLRAVGQFVVHYNDASANLGRANVAVDALSIYLAAFMVGRTWIDALTRRTPRASTGARLLLVEELLAHPGELQP